MRFLRRFGSAVIKAVVDRQRRAVHLTLHLAHYKVQDKLTEMYSALQMCAKTRVLPLVKSFWFISSSGFQAGSSTAQRRDRLLGTGE